MGKCNCGAFAGDKHLFDCPAHFDETNRKLTGIVVDEASEVTPEMFYDSLPLRAGGIRPLHFGDDSMAIDAPPDKLELRAGGMHSVDYEIPLDGGRLSLGCDPRNYFGRHFFPRGYDGILAGQIQKGWAAKIRGKIFKRFGPL